MMFFSFNILINLTLIIRIQRMQVTFPKYIAYLILNTLLHLLFIVDIPIIIHSILALFYLSWLRRSDDSGAYIS